MAKPILRKLLVTTHVVVSVGWLGGRERSGARHRGARRVIIPLSIATLVTGIVQALGTQWGLFRHTWVLTKFLITIAAVALLLLHTSSLLPALSRAAIDGSAVVIDGRAHGHGGLSPRMHLVVAASGTLLLLFVAALLSVVKPWGKTRFARR